MRFDILTLFPAMFTGPLTESILRRAVERELLDIRLHDIRDHAVDRHRTTDDAPYGGGSGMVMKPEPIAACLAAVREQNPGAPVLLTTPQGEPLSHRLVLELAKQPGLVIICGRYEGIDERVRELYVDREVSLGDFVLTGGELAAMAIVDAVGRQVPGVLGSQASAACDSFADGLLEYPQYTRPPEFAGLSVPEILLSGDHALVERWRREQSLRRTWQRRPDLLAAAELNAADRDYLARLAEQG